MNGALHPAVQLHALIAAQDLRIPGAVENGLWSASWAPAPSRTAAHVAMTAPVRLEQGQLIETVLELAKVGVVVLRVTATGGRTELHFISSYLVPAFTSPDEFGFLRILPAPGEGGCYAQ